MQNEQTQNNPHKNPQDNLRGAKIALGVSGGIAAYKAPLIIRLLKKAGADVRVLATDSALQFTTRWTLETLSENPLETELFPKSSVGGTHHIDTAAWADCFVVAPVTANLLGKIASGISDDILTTTLCAYTGPVLLAPAMNTNMYLNPVTKKNLKFLRSIGYTIIDPEEGEMACHTVGIGRMAEPETVFERIAEILAQGGRKSEASSTPARESALAGLSALVTAGPCREKIDPVRYISNHSSGKMGYALARAAQSAGANVTLISGPTDLTPPDNVAFISVETTRQMSDAVLANLPDSGALIMAAAPADYMPETEHSQKIKKSGESIQIKLVPTPDILKQVALEVASKKLDNLTVIGFALESENLTENATAKLREKKLDMIVANPAAESGSGPRSNTNRATLISADGTVEELPLQSKDSLAEEIILRLISLIRLRKATHTAN